MSTPTPKTKRDGNAVSKRAYHDQNWYPSDLVPGDDRQTQFVDMSRAAFGMPGTYLWTRGLAPCIGVAIYGVPTGAPTQGGKILGHVSGVNYQGQLTTIDTLATNNAHYLPNKVIYLILPDLRYPPREWSTAMIGALQQMINDVWNHFATRYPEATIRPEYHVVEYAGRNGEMVINYRNAIYIDGSQTCVN